MPHTYEYKISFNLCSMRWLNSYTVCGFPEAHMHYGINNGTNFTQCWNGKSFSFTYDTTIGPNRIKLAIDAIIKNYVSKHISDLEKSLNENNTVCGYFRCYKNIKITLMPPKYEYSIKNSEPPAYSESDEE